MVSLLRSRYEKRKDKALRAGETPRSIERKPDSFYIHFLMPDRFDKRNPRVNTAKGITKDAGKRRVQVDGQATGHWSIPTLLRSSLEAPSLLGFDDLPEPQITPALEETKQSNTSNRVPPVADDDDEFEIQTLTVAH
ncbi:hypothetical protein Tco_0738358 [Tanacetum coccineum]